MNAYVLDSHSTRCKTDVPYNKIPDLNTLRVQSVKNGAISERHWCEKTINHDVFFINNEFIMISYFNCLVRQNDYNQKHGWLKEILDNSSKVRFYDIYRTTDINKTLNEYRLKGKPLNNNITQVHYIYGDNAGKNYAICSDVSFIDLVYSGKEIKKNYLNAVNYIEKRFKDTTEKEWILRSLQDLFHSNYITEPNDTIVVKTIDSLIKEINSLTKF